jgi:transcriptional regulator with XRE-family HTH domain
MGRRTRVSLVHRRALNQALLYTGRSPEQARLVPAVYLRALRSALRMSQAQLARRSGVAQHHIALVESRAVDPRLGTLRRLFDALYCDLLVLPRARKRPSDALAEREVERPSWLGPWD